MNPESRNMNSNNPERIPRHVAIIMDGNGRWAEQRGMERAYGHVQGVESVRRVVKAATRWGIEYLTIYAFSTENWGRPTEEVSALMELLCENSMGEAPALQKAGVRMRFIGNIAGLSERVQKALRRSEAMTAGDTKLTLQIAVNYSSRWEITEMVRHLADEVKAGTLSSAEITPEVISNHLTTAGIPDPDLLIRTSGEHRLSNFLLWQLSYSELYFTDIFWPDFDEQAFDLAVKDFQNRQRRYGLLTK